MMRKNPIGMWFRRFLRGRQGGMLLEVLIVLGLLTTVLAVAIQGLATGSRGVNTVRELTTAQNLARSQLEYTLAADYCPPPCSYPTIDVPPGYEVTAEAQAYPGADSNLANVVVKVSSGNRVLVELTGLKVNR